MRKGLRILLTLLLIGAACLPAAAKQYDYVITGEGVKLPITVGYRFKAIISYADAEEPYLSEPSDLFIDGEDNVYIADTGNDRVLKFNKELVLEREYTLEDTATPLSSPGGVYVDSRHTLYIADTGNGRVAHVGQNGEWIEDFTAPDSKLFDAESYGFAPNKVALDNFGYLCILNGNDYHGIIKLDAQNQFIGYYGTNKVVSTLSDVIIRNFGSEEQKEQYMKKQPPYITSLFVDDSGYTYTTNALVSDQEVKKLDQNGANVYANTGTFAEKEAVKNSLFSDLHVSASGVVTAVDSLQRKVYEYDDKGNMLCAFGGEGSVEGTFAYPVAVSRDSRGNLYVLDRERGNVQIFERTAFMEHVHTYLSQFHSGEYDACTETIQAVLRTDSTYLPAYRTLGSLYYKQGAYPASMDAYRAVNDMAGYSTAFDKQRQIGYRQYFVWILLGVVALAIGTVVAVSRTRRWARRKILDGMVNKDTGEEVCSRSFLRRCLSGRFRQNLLITLYYPADGYERLRRKKPYGQALVLYVCVAAVTVLQTLFTHRPLAMVYPEQANLFLEICKVLVPLLSFVLVSYGMATLHDGEAKIGDVFIGTAFSMLPYLLMTPLLIALSHMLSLSDAAIYYGLFSLMWVWVFYQFYRQVNILNNYTLPQTLSLLLLTLCGILAVWALLALLYFLSRNLFQFIEELFREIYMIFS